MQGLQIPKNSKRLYSDHLDNEQLLRLGGPTKIKSSENILQMSLKYTRPPNTENIFKAIRI